MKKRNILSLFALLFAFIGYFSYSASASPPTKQNHYNIDKIISHNVTSNQNIGFKYEPYQLDGLSSVFNWKFFDKIKYITIWKIGQNKEAFKNNPCFQFHPKLC